MDLLSNVGRRSLGHEQEFPSIVKIEDESLNGFEHNKLFESDGGGGFDEVAYHLGVDNVLDGRAVIAFDYDRDGDQDLFMTHRGSAPTLLRNDNPRSSWLQLKLIGTRSNRDAVGARITLEAKGRMQTREVHLGGSFLATGPLVQHFGLGDLRRADRITVVWPTGIVQTLEDVPVDQRLEIVEEP